MRGNNYQLFHKIGDIWKGERRSGVAFMPLPTFSPWIHSCFTGDFRLQFPNPLPKYSVRVGINASHSQYSFSDTATDGCHLLRRFKCRLLLLSPGTPCCYQPPAAKNAPEHKVACDPAPTGNARQEQPPSKGRGQPGVRKIGEQACASGSETAVRSLVS